jgi:hypothetical protein
VRYEALDPANHVPAVNVTVGPTLTGYSIGTVDCSSTATNPKTDVQAFVEGFASLSLLHPVNPPQ